MLLPHQFSRTRAAGEAEPKALPCGSEGERWSSFEIYLMAADSRSEESRKRSKSWRPLEVAYRDGECGRDSRCRETSNGVGPCVWWVGPQPSSDTF